MTSPSLTGRPLTVLLRSVHEDDLPAGAVVALVNTADAAFDIPLGVGAVYHVIGITTEPLATGARGRVQIAGTVRAVVSGTVARGDFLQPSSMAPGLLESTGIASDGLTPPPAGSCAVALEAGSDFEVILVNFTGPTAPAGTGGGGSYTDEMAQDAVGGILVAGDEIGIFYNDATPSIEAWINDASVVPNRLKLNSGVLVGRSFAGEGPGEEISIGAGLALAGGVLSATGGASYTDEQAQDAVGLILVNSPEVALAYVDATPSISAALITNSVVVSRLTMATARLVGRTTAGAGAGEEISIGAGLTLTGGVLAATGGAGVSFANPTALVGLAAVNGVLDTAMRSDAAPALSQAIAPTWTGVHAWTNRTGRTGTLAPAGVANDYIHHYSDQTIAPTADNSQYHNYLSPLFAPATGRTIPIITVEHVILRTGNAGGVITSARGITVQAQYGTQKPTNTVVGIAVENMGTTGVGQTQAIGIKPQTGTGAFALVSEGGENRLVGATVFNNLSAAVAPIQLTGVVPTIYGYLGEASYPSGGAQVRAMWVTSNIMPASNLTYGIGASMAPYFSPPTGVNIGDAWAFHALIQTGNTGGTVTTGAAFVAYGLYGSIKPTTTYGILINNLGAAGVTATYGVYVGAQVGSGLNISIYSAGENRLAGSTTIGANQAPSAGYALDIAGGGRVIKTGARSLGFLESMFYSNHTITHTAAVGSSVHVGDTFNGAGDEPVALLIRPFFNPSAPITTAYGGSLAVIHNGGTITGDAIGFRAGVATFANTGAVGRFVGVRIDTPTMVGSVRPTTSAGLVIGNVAYAGIANAIGLQIENIVGSTLNIAIRQLGGQNRLVGQTTFGADSTPDANALISLVTNGSQGRAFNVSGPAVVAGNKTTTGAGGNVYFAVGINGSIRYVQTYI